MITINSSQLMSLKSTPIKLATTGEAGVMNIPYLILMKHIYGSTPYNLSGTDLRVLVGGIWLFQEISWSFLSDASEERGIYQSNIIVQPHFSVSEYLSSDMYLVNVGQNDLSGGDGILTISMGFFKDGL